MNWPTPTGFSENIGEAIVLYPETLLFLLFRKFELELKSFLYGSFYGGDITPSGLALNYSSSLTEKLTSYLLSLKFSTEPLNGDDLVGL